MDIRFNHTEPVNASAETLFDVITDYANYPSFNSALIKVTVVTKNEQGAEFLDRYRESVVMASPRRFIQRLVVPPLARLARWRRVGRFERW